MNEHKSYSTAYLLLGSNMGKCLENLDFARTKIAQYLGDIEQESSVYKTAAWGIKEQPDFYNQALKIRTMMSAESLLAKMLDIEIEAGRKRLIRWGSRTLDIDLLFYNNDIIQTEKLIVPHPELHNRAFTLIPLIEIGQTIFHPLLKMTVSELLEKCEDDSEVEKVDLT